MTFVSLSRKEWFQVCKQKLFVASKIDREESVIVAHCPDEVMEEFSGFFCLQRRHRRS